MSKSCELSPPDSVKDDTVNRQHRRKAPSRRKGARKQKQQINDRLLVASCDEVAKSLGFSEWDLMLVGDGSGNSWKIGCGWSCIVLDRLAKKRRVLYGGMNSGTIAIAEMLPYLHAMLWFDGNRGKKVKEQLGREIKVHVISDHEWTVIAGNSVSKRLPNASKILSSKPLWAAMQQFERNGYELRYHWLRRDTLSLNTFADILSVKARLSMGEVTIPEKKDGTVINVDALNPF